jgi:hypothetical protein
MKLIQQTIRYLDRAKAEELEEMSRNNTPPTTPRQTHAGRTAATDPARKRQRTAVAVVSSENDAADNSSAEHGEVEVIDDTKYHPVDMTHLKKLIDKSRLDAGTDNEQE